MSKKYKSSESTTSFVFSELFLNLKKDLKEKYSKLSDEQIKSIYPEATEEQLKNKNLIPEEILYKMMCISLKKFTLNDQTFEYSARKNYLGGYRWYVLCPKCKTKCLKLFLPNKYEEKEQLYLCKECHELKNSSLLEGSTKEYKKVLKPLKKLESIKIKLLKKNMRPEKAEELLLEYEKIERELAPSIEYRLWKFKQEHAAIPNSLP
jgi:hypothetical protein